MNRFDERYIFRRAMYDDADELMRFIADEWPKKNHIFAINKDFFLYEFQDGDLLNFVIAVNKSTNEIDGMFGFYPASDIKEKLDIWTCMWLTRRKGSTPFLGLEILKRMKSIVNYRYLTGVGTDPKTAMPLAMGKANHYGFKFKHFYMISEQTEYKISIIKSLPTPKKPTGTPPATLALIKSVNELSDSSKNAFGFSIPLKNEWYINKRYFCHPIYEYLVWEIISENENGILVGREIQQNGTRILRIVDFIGSPELLDGLFDEFFALKQNYEYIDFYVHGVDDIHIMNAGFTLKTEDDGNVIPHYFEPFIQSNIDVYGTSEIPNVRMCKADADLDRPNICQNL